MIRCREFFDFLAAYVEGELPARERRVFEAHLARCPYCADYLASYRATEALAREALAEGEGAPPPDVPEELVVAVLAARTRRG